jgi:sortase (surface protein transpeptidase)
MALVFGLGLAAVWMPSIPRVVTSSVGPTVGSVGEPVRLVVPSLKIDAPVVPIELGRDRVLRPPNDPGKVGWWNRSAQPGAKEGQSLLTGHSVRLGDGAMDTLGDVRRGATVQIVGETEKGEKDPKVASYSVQKVFVYSREEVAKHSDELFGQDSKTTARRLVLVTCTDWDGRVYQSNIIVYARPS